MMCHNLKLASDILHYSGSRFVLHPFKGVRDSILLPEDGLHSFIDLSRVPAFASDSQTASCACSSVKLPSIRTTRPWPQIRHVIDKVHCHTCNHATLSDILTLRQRNNYWNDASQRYLADIIHALNTMRLRHLPLRRTKLLSDHLTDFRTISFLSTISFLMK